MSTLTEEQERKEREEREEEIRKKKEKEHLEHCKVLSGHLASLVNNKENYDVTFLVGNLDEGESLERIYAHRAILAARSKVFRAMFYMGFKESNSPEIKIPNISAKTFIELLRYIYTGSVTITVDNVMQLLPAADEFGLHDLRLSCFELLVKAVNKDTVCTMMIAAQRGDYDFNAERLITKCISFVEKHTTDVFQSEAFVQFDERVIIEMFQSNKLSIDEIDVFKAAIRWGKARQKETGKPLKEILKNIIPHIRFPLISASELLKIVKPEGVVPKNIYLAALEHNAAPHLTPKELLNTPMYNAREGCARFHFEINPRSKGEFTLSNKNMTVKKTGGSCTWTNCMIFGNKPLKGGKLYWEIKLDKINSDKSGTTIGITANKNSSYFSSDITIGMSGNKYKVTGSSYSVMQGDRIGVMVDFNKGQISFYKNGSPMNVTGTITKGTVYYPVIHIYYVGDQFTLSFPPKPKPGK